MYQGLTVVGLWQVSSRSSRRGCACWDFPHTGESMARGGRWPQSPTPPAPWNTLETTASGTKMELGAEKRKKEILQGRKEVRIGNILKS